MKPRIYRDGRYKCPWTVEYFDELWNGIIRFNCHTHKEALEDLCRYYSYGWVKR